MSVVRLRRVTASSAGVTSGAEWNRRLRDGPRLALSPVMKTTRKIAAALLVTLTFGVLAGCFVETPGAYHRHRHVIVVR